MKRFLMFIAILLMLVVLLYTFATTAQAAEFGDGPRARGVLTSQVKKMFTDRKFAEIDAMADEFRTTKSRFPDGVWKLQIFITAFDLATRTPQWAFGSYISLAEEWCRTRPKSITARTVLAKAWSDYAWKERGGGYASEVKEEAWPVVRERLDKAWQIINEPLLPGVSDCPTRHNLRLTLAKTRGVERELFEELFQEALRQSPGYYHHYAIKAGYLHPKWHGEEGEWQRFIENVVDRNPGNEGATIYTRTAWSMFLGNDWQNFLDSGVSWTKMKAGFTEIDRNYPNSPWILNTFAKFACRAGDRDTANALFKRIGLDSFYPEAWGSDNVDSCRSWAGVPTMAELNKPLLDEQSRRLQARVFQNLLELAEKGNRQIVGDLSGMYLRGEGTDSNPISAYAWLAQDEAANAEQLASIAKSLTAEQLHQARQQSEEIRRRISLQNK